MARKSNLFTIDVKKENPLITILRHGKIPVIRFANKGFQNYKQKGYCNSREITGKKPEKGCFVLLGGVQGNYVTGGHWKENLNIGYIEPDEKIYATYSFGNRKNKSFTYITAKERFDDAKLSYELFAKVKEKKNYSFEDFDIYTEAIVDSTKIKKLTVLKPEEFEDLVPYANDKFFKLYDIESIFSCIEPYISQEFWNHIAFPNAIKEIELYYESDNYKYNRLDYYPEYYEKYQNLILKEFEHFYKTGSFLKEKSYYEKLKKAHYEWNEFVKTGFNDVKDNTYNFYYDENVSWYSRKTNIAYLINGYIFDKNQFYLTLNFDPRNNKDKIKSISYNHQNNKISIVKAETIYGEVIDFLDITEKELLFCNKYRYLSYNFLLVIDKFYSLFSEGYDLILPSWYKELKSFYELELFLTKYEYSYLEEYNEFHIETETFSLDYNIVLKDGILTIPNSEKIYYNLENLPNNFDSTELHEILRPLNLLGSFIFSLIFH